MCIYTIKIVVSLYLDAKASLGMTDFKFGTPLDFDPDTVSLVSLAGPDMNMNMNMFLERHCHWLLASLWSDALGVDMSQRY